MTMLGGRGDGGGSGGAAKGQDDAYGDLPRSRPDPMDDEIPF